jgi:hypothetical protein
MVWLQGALASQQDCARYHVGERHCVESNVVKEPDKPDTSSLVQWHHRHQEGPPNPTRRCTLKC